MLELVIIATVALVILKLIGWVTVSWWLIFDPIFVVLLLMAIFIAGMEGYIGYWFGRIANSWKNFWKEKRY